MNITRTRTTKTTTIVCFVSNYLRLVFVAKIVRTQVVTKMFGACPANGRLQNTSPGYRVGAEGMQRGNRDGQGKTERTSCRETQPEELNMDNLGGCQRIGGRHDRIASTCDLVRPPECWMNRTEQSNFTINRSVMFTDYYEQCLLHCERRK